MAPLFIAENILKISKQTNSKIFQLTKKPPKIEVACWRFLFFLTQLPFKIHYDFLITIFISFLAPEEPEQPNLKPLANEKDMARRPPTPSAAPTSSWFTPKRYFLVLLPRGFFFFLGFLIMRVVGTLCELVPEKIYPLGSVWFRCIIVCGGQF